MENNKIRETVEDAAERLYPHALYENDYNALQNRKRAEFISGAKWQAENMPVHILDVDGIHAYIKDGMVVIEKK